MVFSCYTKSLEKISTEEKTYEYVYSNDHQFIVASDLLLLLREIESKIDGISDFTKRKITFRVC
jgi:hypothetical protein